MSEQWLDFTVDRKMLEDRLPRLIDDRLTRRYEAADFVALLSERLKPPKEARSSGEWFGQLLGRATGLEPDLGDLRYARMLKGAIEETVTRNPGVRVWVVME